MSLKRELRFIDVYSIATGAMISSGLFVLPGLAHAKAGPAVVFSYLLAGLLALPGMLSQAELVSAMPRAGGTYFYVMRSMGPAAGTVDGLVTWFSMSLKTTLALVGMAAFTSYFIDVDIRLIGAVLALFFITINIIGIREAGRLQMVLVAGLLAILAVYICASARHMNVSHLTPFAPHGIEGILATAGFVFISYGGLLKVASVAEEAHNPSVNLPRAMILSLMTVIVIYTVAVFVTTGVLDGVVLNGSLTPLTDGANAVLGRRGGIALSIAAMLAFISTANAGIMAASRYPLALARDNLLPSAFGEVNMRLGTPVNAIILTGVMIVAFLFVNLDFLVKTASTVLVLTFIFSCLCVIIMRESGVQNYQPKFTVPLYPWVQGAGIILYMVLIAEMGREAVYSGLALVACGLFVYWYYGRVRSNREFALLYLIKRITAKELTTIDLDNELKDIIRERDDIVKDRFDEIVENCLVLDIEEHITVDDFFEIAAEKLSSRLSISPEEIKRLLIEREKENSTIIAPGLAIPHIIIEGEQTFDILLARCKPGITFSDKFDDIKTVFILAGTSDERNFHLRALSAIAQIVHFHQFPKRWMSARGKDGLRDVVLLGRRKRL